MALTFTKIFEVAADGVIACCKIVAVAKLPIVVMSVVVDCNTCIICPGAFNTWPLAISTVVGFAELANP